jgi:hypothetical protein
VTIVSPSPGAPGRDLLKQHPRSGLLTRRDYQTNSNFFHTTLDSVLRTGNLSLKCVVAPIDKSFANRHNYGIDSWSNRERACAIRARHFSRTAIPGMGAAGK